MCANQSTAFDRRVAPGVLAVAAGGGPVGEDDAGGADVPGAARDHAGAELAWVDLARRIVEAGSGGAKRPRALKFKLAYSAAGRPRVRRRSRDARFAG